MVIACNSRQIAQLLEARTGLRYSYRNIYQRLTTRRDGVCPVTPLHTRLSGRKNGVVIDARDYPAFEAWIADRPIEQCPPLTADELAAVGCNPAAQAA